jgi:hypothetical protein
MAGKRKTDADRLRELIAKASLSQRAFAREIDYSERMICYMVAGDRPVERVVMLAAEHLALCARSRQVGGDT